MYITNVIYYALLFIYMLPPAHMLNKDIRPLI
jgi:hypothetical protein